MGLRTYNKVVQRLVTPGMTESTIRPLTSRGLATIFSIANSNRTRNFEIYRFNLPVISVGTAFFCRKAPKGAEDSENNESLVIQIQSCTILPAHHCLSTF